MDGGQLEVLAHRRHGGRFFPPYPRKLMKYGTLEPNEEGQSLD